MIKLADTLKAMSDFPVALADSIYFDDDSSLQEKFDNKELGGGDSSVTLTQEEYEALPEEEKLNGLYYTYDTKRIYKNGVQYGASEPIPLTMEEYKTLKEAGAIDEQQEYLVEADAEGIFLEASDIGYSNAVSNLPCTTVQGAIDKVNDKVDNLIDDEVSDSTVWSSKKTSDEIKNVNMIATNATIEVAHKASINDTASSTTSTWSSSKIKSEITSTFLIKDIAAGGENEKTVSFKIRKDYFVAYYAKRTFLLSANIYSLGFSKPVIGLVEIFRDSTDNYGGYVVNLQDTRYTGVTVTVNGDYLEVVVTFNSYESSGCMISCSSLSNIPIA